MVTQRRGLVWVSTISPVQTLAAGAQTSVLLFNDSTFGGRQVKGATVTRLLMDISLRADAVAQLNSLMYGVTIVNSDAAGAGAFPDADVMGDRASWMVRGRLETISANLSDSSQWDRRSMDIRGQRVFRNEEDSLYLIVDSTSTFVLQWAAFMRVLLKAPV